MLRPAPAPAARDWRAPKDAMGFTELLVLEVGEEPAVKRRENKNQVWHITNPSDILPIHISHALTAQTCKANETEKKQQTVMREVKYFRVQKVNKSNNKDSTLKQMMGIIKSQDG